MVHIINGIKKYHIDSLEKWVWRIAHNRYARFINMKNKRKEIIYDFDFTEIHDDYDFVDELIIVEEFQQVFIYLHTLSSEYRNIMVDYYIKQLSVKEIAKYYSLTKTTVKWRLNISRERIKTRIGENKMNRVYNKLIWNIQICNGGYFNPNDYLYSQISRAICEATYDKLLTIEEISLKTGLPTLFIEDELPRLIQGDAIIKKGKKYLTNFIIFHLDDRKELITKFTPIINSIADYFTEIFKKNKIILSNVNFCDIDMTINRYGYIILPAVLREKIKKIKDKLNIKDVPCPPRLDGGFGWFIAIEKEIEEENYDIFNNGYYITGNIKNDANDLIYYFMLNNYNRIEYEIINWIHKNKIIEKLKNGFLSDNELTDDEKVPLIKNNLIIKVKDRYKINFPVFDKKQYNKMIECFNKTDDKLDNSLTDLIINIHKYFKMIIPKHLDDQINNLLSGYVQNIIGFVAEELIKRSILDKPDGERPLISGIFCILGEYVEM